MDTSPVKSHPIQSYPASDIHTIQDFCDESLVPTTVALFKTLPYLHTLDITQPDEIGVQIV
ncbi:hypothetical protein C1H46_016462 [Malus baccata]|uniref:Uncharacterized protein n=1 Tax=Malus baccata TaxID=106549 RepID=A0A540MGQ0_MALBA|nr:hypothetical protein C1H46_016462 [Malus baccata]